MARPTLFVFVDWANNGNYTGPYDDITSDVLGLSWWRGAADWAGGLAAGGATITVKNASGKYYPDNDGGLIYGLLLPGRRVWVYASYELANYGIFAGYIERIVPTIAGGEEVAEITCHDTIPYWQRRKVYVDANLSESKSIGACRDWILDFQLGADSPVLPAGENADALVGLGHEHADAVQVLDELNKANGTRHFIRPSGVVISGSVAWQYVAKRRCDDLSTAVDETIANPYAINGYAVSSDNIINAPDVTYTEVSEEYPTDREVWRHERTWPWTINGSATLIVSLSQPCAELWADYDHTDGGGSRDFAGTFTVVNCGLTAIINIQVDMGGTDYLYSLWLRGIPLVTASVTPTNEDATSIAAYGRAGPSIASPFLQSEAQAVGLGDYLIWRFASPKQRPVITIKDRFPTVLAREVFDVIGLTVTRLYVTNRRFEIVGLRGFMTPGAGWQVEYSLEEMPEQGTLTGWFTIGTSALDGTDKLAY